MKQNGKHSEDQLSMIFKQKTHCFYRGPNLLLWWSQQYPLWYYDELQVVNWIDEQPTIKGY